jgi:hypothetical protein
MTVPATLEPTSAPPAGRQRRWASRRARLVGALTGIVLALMVAGLVAWLTQVPDNATKRADSRIPASWQRPVVTADSLVQQSGVKITQVAVTGDGGLVDLRFKVVDPERANTLHDQSTPPAVVDEQSGLVVHELFMNHSHTGPFKAGVTYYLVFNNPGNWVHHGSRVTVLLGNAAVGHVLVP